MVFLPSLHCCSQLEGYIKRCYNMMLVVTLCVLLSYQVVTTGSTITPICTAIPLQESRAKVVWVYDYYKMCKVKILQLLQAAFRRLRWLYCQCNSALKCHRNLTSYCFWWLLQQRTWAAFSLWWEMPKSVANNCKSDANRGDAKVALLTSVRVEQFASVKSYFTLSSVLSLSDWELQYISI